MNYRKTNILRQLLTLSASLLLSVTAATAATYTKEHPLTVAGDWDFPPYEFSNNSGRPDGINVEVVSTILDRLHIPHRFVMKDWSEAATMFERHEADIIIDPRQKYKGQPYYQSNSILNYFRVVVAMREGSAPVASLADLQGKEETVVVKNHSYMAFDMLHTAAPDIRPEFHSSKTALAGLRGGRFGYFVWGEEPMKWTIRQLQLDSIAICNIGSPLGEIHLVGHDKGIIDEIDEQFTRLEQSGDLDLLRDKWFHPERQHNDSSPVAVYVTLAVLLVAILAYVLSRLVRARLLRGKRQNVDLQNMMGQALSMGEYYVYVYDVEARTFSNLHGHLLPDEGISSDEFLHRMLPDDADALIAKTRQRLNEGVLDTFTQRSWNVGTAENPVYRTFQGNAMVEKDAHGKPQYIVTILRDVTKEVEEQNTILETGTKYHRLFDSALVAISFYGPDGMLIDLNESMKRLCGFDKLGEEFFQQTCMFDMPLLANDFDPDSRENFHACQHMEYPEIGLDKYVEFKVRPICDGERLAYYVITARDVTDERTMYLSQVAYDHQLQKANADINNYETELRYLLDNSNMYVWHSDVAKGIIEFSRSLRISEFSETFKEYIDGMFEEDRKQAASHFADPEYMSQPFNTVHHFLHTPVSDEPSWCAISGIPLRDEQGNVIGHMGIVRDVTRLFDAQERLRQETARADDSGKMKSAFLANMTHEIRTPLNAIVGFSDLLQVIDDASERREFIRIIRNNCDMLLRLINDILEASNMGQALSIEPEEVDFSAVFDDICQTLAQRVQEPGVEFVKDNPYPSFRTVLDKGRVQQVLTNFVTNAVKYTHEGHIRVGYRREADGLYFYCEDTGAGIPKDKQDSVFERFVKLNDFVQGTGLGLSICKSIAERCGGRIGVTSEGEGHGSTFWMWIPCQEL